jgi:CheY-like chemotaxis protein
MLRLAAIDVLVVEDHGPTLQMICEVLLVLGIGRVRGVNCGGDALHALAERCPDIMLVDWEMPGISGFDVVDFLRSSPDSPAPKMPIMMISAHSTKERVLKARDIGVNEFLVKPFDPQALVQRLCSCLEMTRQPLSVVSAPGEQLKKPIGYGVVSSQSSDIKNMECNGIKS